MTDLYERLRRIRESKQFDRKPEIPEDSNSPRDIVEAPSSHSGDSSRGSTPPGEGWHALASGVYHRSRTLPVPDRYGCQIGRAGTWRSASSVLRIPPECMPLFVDVETSGLSSGSGSVAFLVGIGKFLREDADGESSPLVQVDQLFLSDFGAEAEYTDVLHRMISRVDSTTASDESSAPHTTRVPVYVTYNGATFDLPVLRTRAIMTRRRFPEYPHLDLLPATRRLYAPIIGSCKLSAVEARVLGVTRARDVPGYEVPARYLEFVRTGETAGLAPVLEHHFYDIAYLALLGLHLNEVFLHRGDLYRTGGVEDDPVAPDQAGVLRLLIERGTPAERERAEELLQDQVRRLDPRRYHETREHMRDRWIRLALRHADASRRSGDRRELIRTLEALWETRSLREDGVALAKQLEHYRKDYVGALRVVSSAGNHWGWDEELIHRASRLRRRIEKSSR